MLISFKNYTYFNGEIMEANNVKELVEKYIELEEIGSEEELHQLGHEIDHEVYRNEFFLIINQRDGDEEIVALLIGENEEFFLPVYTSEDETKEAMEFFLQQEGSGEFKIETATGSELIEAYADDEEFLGLAINAPQCDFVVFAETVHDCEE